VKESGQKKELKDYSGPYIPNLKYEDFSKEVLVKLLLAYSREVNVLPTYWAEEVRKRLGKEVEKECLLSTWTRIGKYETGWAMQAAGIEGNDVETYVKATQLMGSFAQGYYKYDFDLKNKNHAILTVYYCPAFNAMEKQGDLEWLDWVCTVLEDEGMKAYVRPVNPEIQVKRLRAGRRKSKDEPHCRWEFKLEK
jgi:hypothetical protein